MTVEELHAVIIQRMDDLESSRESRHAEVLYRLDKINGRLTRHDDAITELKSRDAFWAGGAAVVGAVIAWLWGKL